MTGYTYVYQQVTAYDADSLNSAENRLCKLAETAGIEVVGCVRDTIRTRPSGIRKLIDILTESPFDVLLVEELKRLGSGKLYNDLIALIQKNAVRILTLRGEVTPKVLRPSDEVVRE